MTVTSETAGVFTSPARHNYSRHPIVIKKAPPRPHFIRSCTQISNIAAYRIFTPLGRRRRILTLSTTKTLLVTVLTTVHSWTCMRERSASTPPLGEDVLAPQSSRLLSSLQSDSTLWLYYRHSLLLHRRNISIIILRGEN